MTNSNPNLSFDNGTRLSKLNWDDKQNNRRMTIRDAVEKLTKEYRKNKNNKAFILLKEWGKDRLKISHEHWDNLLKVCTGQELLLAKDIYNGQGLLHSWCIRSHVYLIEPLLNLEPNLVHTEDDDGNTPFHALWRNTISNECELVSMYNLMKLQEIDIFKPNSSGVTGLDILEQRVTENNPYDNVGSVKLFYQYLVEKLPVSHPFRLNRLGKFHWLYINIFDSHP